MSSGPSSACRCARRAGEKEKPPNRQPNRTGEQLPRTAGGRERRSSEKSTARLIRSLRRGTATLKLNLRPGSGAESRSASANDMRWARAPLPALDSLEVRHITSSSALCRGTLAARDLSSSRLFIPVLAMNASRDLSSSRLPVLAMMHLPPPRPYPKAYPLPSLSLIPPSLRAAIAAQLAVVVAITTALRPAALPFLLLL